MISLIATARKCEAGSSEKLLGIRWSNNGKLVIFLKGRTLFVLCFTRPHKKIDNNGDIPAWQEHSTTFLVSNKLVLNNMNYNL